MGWFSGSDDNDKSKESNKDPFKDLDPTLKEFLEKESPVSYKPDPPPPPIPAPAPQQTVKAGAPPENPSRAQSLFKDGRYDHLWKTYKPLSEVDAANKTDQEKLLDVLEGYKDRKAAIGAAALENCALENMAISDCFRHGGWGKRFTMCRKETQNLERCYVMQNVSYPITLPLLGSYANLYIIRGFSKH